MMQIDKRQNSRPFFHIPIDECNDHINIRGMTINLSQNGLCYYRPCNEQHQPGKLLILSFKAPSDRKPIYVLGEVIYDHPLEDYNITGIAFQRLSANIQSTIESIITKYTLYPKTISSERAPTNTFNEFQYSL